MSDTPKTDELAKREFVPDGVWIRHARELERENAALRQDKDRLDWLSNSLGWVIVGYPEADPTNYATEDNTLADAWRAAIDDARAKEAQL